MKQIDNNNCPKKESENIIAHRVLRGSINIVENRKEKICAKD